MSVDFLALLRLSLSFDRIYPGRHFAVRTLCLNIARILAVFDIEAPAGEKLEAKFDSNFVR